MRDLFDAWAPLPEGRRLDAGPNEFVATIGVLQPARAELVALARRHMPESRTVRSSRTAGCSSTAGTVSSTRSSGPWSTGIAPTALPPSPFETG